MSKGSSSWVGSRLLKVDDKARRCPATKAAGLRTRPRHCDTAVRVAIVLVIDSPASGALNTVRLATADASLETDMLAEGMREM